ncbi:MAG: hypothetical protein PHW11_08865 [Anaerolineaceae bacterium]|jgi:hypothetical protein|nr:hypothetical protein [Anaerolineaceae bacterium]MDD4043634.1 hypothetical protein [Anaerolineaceae bacterium]MDD4577593.1 hypothetical protein [Anaerolineaceae bacterium]
MTTNEQVNLLWVALWTVVSAAWSVLSFQWLRKSIEEIHPVQDGGKSHLTGLIIRRVSVFLMIGLLIFLALKTEPVAAVAIAITVTVVTWVQVIIYNVKINKQDAGRKEQ